MSNDTKNKVIEILKSVQRIKRGRKPYQKLGIIRKGEVVQIVIGHSAFRGIAMWDSNRGFVTVRYVGFSGEAETRPIRLRHVRRVEEETK